MPVSDTLTWDLNPPRRAALSDITDGTKVNRPGKEPSPAMPNAHEDNQKSAQAGAFAKTVYLARITVTFAAGVPSIANVLAPGTNITPASFPAPTDNGDGDTTIQWTSATLPPVSGAPDVSQCDDVEIDRKRAFYTTVGSNQAVRIKTKLGAVGTDANFVVTIY